MLRVVDRIERLGLGILNDREDLEEIKDLRNLQDLEDLTQTDLQDLQDHHFMLLVVNRTDSFLTAIPVNSHVFQTDSRRVNIKCVPST
jgi:hypothetical protein